MKITGISIYRTQLSCVGGTYGWDAGSLIDTANTSVVVIDTGACVSGCGETTTVAHFAASTPAEFLVNSTDLHNYNTRSTGHPGPQTRSEKLYASDASGLGVKPDFVSLSAPIAVYGPQS